MTRPETVILSHSQIASILTVDMAIEAVQRVMKAHGEGTVIEPDLLHADAPRGEFHIKTGGILKGVDEGVFGLRKCFILPMVPKLQRSRQRRLQKDLMHQSVVVLFVSVGLMLSCSSTKDGDRVTVKPGVGAKKGDALRVAPEEKRMFEVKSPADLSSLNVEYMKLWNDEFDGTLEVNFAPGTYAGTGWSLEPELSGPNREAAPTIDVVLRGDGAVLGALPGGIRARDRRTLLRRAANWR